MKFSLANLGTLIVTLCVVCAWYVDRTRLQQENARLIRVQELDNLHDAVAQRDRSTRFIGVQKLSELGTTESIPPLIFALSDPDLEVCELAREALEKITEASFRANLEFDGASSHEDFQTERTKWTAWYREHYPQDDFEFTAVFRKSSNLKYEVDAEQTKWKAPDRTAFDANSTKATKE